MKPMVRILMVTHQSDTLPELVSTLQRKAPEWVLECSDHPSRALQRIAHKDYDAIISDMLMPKMTGLEFLTKVRERSPDTVRIIWASHADWQSGLELMGPAHQYLTRADSPATLIDRIQGSLQLRSRLKSDSLRQIIGKVQSLPSIPSLYFELLQALRAPEPDANVIGAIISRDLGMTAKILKLANSPFFGLTHHVTNPSEAMIYLGVETVERLVLCIQIFSLFATETANAFSTEQLWTHSWDCGWLAKCVAEFDRQSDAEASLAMTAGLLHDVGKLLLATEFAPGFEQALARAKSAGVPLWQAEIQELGASHAEVGAYLLGLWGLPDAIVEAVLDHHDPNSEAPAFATTSCVHLANAFAQPAVPGSVTDLEPNLALSFHTHYLFTDPAQSWKTWVQSRPSLTSGLSDASP
jgi:putative nucleotidyltransferase with HDIG domain